MGIKQLYNDNLRKLPNEDGDVSVMIILIRSCISETIRYLNCLSIVLLKVFDSLQFISSQCALDVPLISRKLEVHPK